MSCSSPRHELSGLRQPDAGSATGPHGAVPDALERGKAQLLPTPVPCCCFPSPSVFPCPFCLVPDFSSFSGLCGPISQSSAASPHLLHFPRSPWGGQPRIIRLTWTCLWRVQRGRSPGSKVPTGSSEDVSRFLAALCSLGGWSLWELSWMSWHFKISNLRVLGAF